MTVAELIEKLKNIPQDLEIVDSANDYIEEVDVTICGYEKVVKII